MQLLSFSPPFYPRGPPLYSILISNSTLFLPNCQKLVFATDFKISSGVLVCLFNLNNRQNGMRGNGLSVTPPVPILTLVCPTVHPSCPFHSTLGILIPPSFPTIPMPLQYVHCTHSLHTISLKTHLLKPPPRHHLLASQHPSIKSNSRPAPNKGKWLPRLRCPPPLPTPLYGKFWLFAWLGNFGLAVCSVST